MTVVSNDRRRTYPGNGVANVFTGPKAKLASYVAVYLVDDLTQVATLVSPGSYTLSGVGGRRQTTITMAVAPAIGQTLLVLRTVPYSQDADISNQGAYLPEVVEQAFDDIEMQVQQLADEADRALRIGDTVTGFSPVLNSFTPLAPLVINATGDGIEPGDTTLTGDMLLRPNLADGKTPGRGASLVAFLQSGVGAIVRWVMDKLRESVTPEDFGAVGDGTDRPVSQWLVGGALDRGYSNLAAIQVDYPHVTALTDSIDWAAFQSAINAATAKGLRVRFSGNYMHNKPLVISERVSVVGTGWVETSTAANPNGTNTRGAKITATAVMTEMVRIKSATANAYIRGTVFGNCLLNAAGLAGRCLYASMIDKCFIENIVGLAATSVGFDITDDNGTGLSFENCFDRISYNWNSNVASDASIGFQFRDGGSGGGMVQNEVGRVYTITKNGDGIRIAGADNNNFYSLGGFISAGGTGYSLRFHNGLSGSPLPARNNQVHYLAGSLYFQTNTYGNRIHRMTSESSKIVDDSAGKNYWTMFDYNPAFPGEYAFEPFYWTDVLTLPVGALQPVGGATLATSASSVPVWELADAATQGVGSVFLAPKRWGRQGNIKAVTVCYAMSAGGSGNIRFQVSGAAIANTEALTATTTEAFTDAAPAGSNFLRKVTYTLSTPIAFAAGDTVQCVVQRIGGDALDTRNGAAVRIASIGIHYTSSGPSFPSVPGWGVTDPTI